MSNVMTASGGGKQHLQEIPLAEGGVKGRHESEKDAANRKGERENQQERFLKELERSEGDSERKLKSTSLKRFFRLSPKKSAEPAEMLAGEHDVDIEEQNPTKDNDDDDVENATVGSSDSKQDTYKRFKIRVGGMHRYSSSQDSESKMDLNDTASRVTLKSSLSNYWNSVFKKKKSKSVNDMARTEEVTTVNYLETLNQDEPQQQSCEPSLVQGIHVLKISEDSN